MSKASSYARRVAERDLAILDRDGFQRRLVQAQDYVARLRSERNALRDRIEKLQSVADIARGILSNGDLQCHTTRAERDARERELRDALKGEKT
jgi:ABC-type transporter Mla subunit MlaD